MKKQGHHRIMGQGDSARDFDPSESMENAGILDVFPIFHTARLEQKIRRSPQLPLCGVAHVLPAAEESIAQGVDFVRQSLQAWRLPSKTIAVTLLTVEELLAQLLRTSQEHADIIIKLYRAFGAVDIKISCLGSPFAASDLEKQLSFDGDMTPDEALAIQNLISRVSGDHVHIAHRKGLNTCTVSVKASEYKSLIAIACALGLGILFGLLMKFLLPESWGPAITKHLLSPISTMFLNALKTVVAPLVLFSIASSIADFDNLKALGRIAGKVMGLYSLVGMSQTMTNVTGDAVVTTIVAKWEKAIDLETFGK